MCLTSSLLLARIIEYICRVSMFSVSESSPPASSLAMGPSAMVLFSTEGSDSSWVFSWVDISVGCLTLSACLYVSRWSDTKQFAAHVDCFVMKCYRSKSRDK